MEDETAPAETLTPSQALALLSNATEPGAKISRRDYALIEHALMVLSRAIHQDNE